jgi:hypothetical protein
MIRTVFWYTGLVTWSLKRWHPRHGLLPTFTTGP